MRELRTLDSDRKVDEGGGQRLLCASRLVVRRTIPKVARAAEVVVLAGGEEGVAVRRLDWHLVHLRRYGWTVWVDGMGGMRGGWGMRRVMLAGDGAGWPRGRAGGCWRDGGGMVAGC